MSDQAQISKTLVKFFSAGTQITCKKGEILMRPGDESPGVYLIFSGVAKSYSISPTDEINIHVFKKKGEVMPLLWALGGEPVRFFTETMSDTTLYRVSRSSFAEFLDANPDVSKYFLGKLVRITERYKIKISNLEHKYVSDRLIGQLLALADNFGKETPDGILIDLPLTHQDIADSINSTRETVSREMSKLEDRNLIGAKNRKILICDKTSLENEL